MRIAIFENIMTPGGHEVDFDRILVEELRALGHEVSFYVPEGFRFALDYRVSVRTLRGSVVSYSGVGGIRRLLRTAKRELHRLAWYRQLMREAETGAFDALILPTSTYPTCARSRKAVCAVRQCRYSSSCMASIRRRRLDSSRHRRGFGHILRFARRC